MRVMVLVKASPESESGGAGKPEDFRAMTAFNERLVAAGVMLSGEGLLPSAKGKRVRFSGKDRGVVDGPFAEAKELVAGFWIWQVKSLEEADKWAREIPFEEGEVEIRQIAEAEDFGDLPQDILDREKALAEELKKKK